MAQLRLGYPDIQRHEAEVLQVTHNTAVEAGRYFKHYPITFPYLCDADRAVHEAYGLPLRMPGPLEPLRSTAAAAFDLVRHGERTPSPVAFLLRNRLLDSPQAVVIVDRAGVVRHVVQSGPNAELPSNADIVRRLESID